MGTTRGARYAERRTVANCGSQWPLYSIDEQGAPNELGRVNAIQRDSYYITSGPQRIQGLFEGIPYYLQDSRPGGFLGRTVPKAYPELALPARVIDWTDEHVISYLTQRGADTPGNLIVGTQALDRYLNGSQEPTVIATARKITEYPKLAEAAMAGNAVGSSAHGEHPKFTACIADGDNRTHVIVKFSPPNVTPTGRRWADLLTAEHLAHRTLEDHGIVACRSTLMDYGSRTFLQCERFDRIGQSGRLGCISLLSIDTTRYGAIDNWTASANRLVQDALLSAQDGEHIRFLDAFGALIGNTDRHFGNISLFDRYEGRLGLAPVYDMLPMLYAPVNDQLVLRQFEPPIVTADWISVFSDARRLAGMYWQRLADDVRISDEFRRTCAKNCERLRYMPPRAAHAIKPN